MKYNRFHLSSAANDYLIRELEGRRSLAKSILRKLDLKKGGVSALLPEGYGDAELYHFKRGWTIPDETSCASGHTPRDSLLHAIRSHLLRVKDGIVIIEDGIAKPEESELKKLKNLFFCGQDVYHFLQGQNHLPLVEKVFLDANVFPGPFGVFTSLGRGQRGTLDRSCLDIGTLDEFAGRTELIFLEAYDSQSFLVWQRT